jgi:hypothetical protein
MGDHFTSSAAGAPVDLSTAAGAAAGERAANNAMIEVTTIDGDNLVLILAYLPDDGSFGRAGLSFERNFVAKVEKPARIVRRRRTQLRPWPNPYRVSQLINLSPATNP